MVGTRFATQASLHQECAGLFLVDEGEQGHGCEGESERPSASRAFGLLGPLTALRQQAQLALLATIIPR
jgi:hypothetical protein